MAVIPLPQVVPNTPEEGWVNNTIKNINALRKQNLENQFYAPLAQADMASKLAYAQYTPAQIAAQFLSSPAAANLTRDQYNALTQRFGNALTSPSPISTTPSPRGDGVLNKIFDLIKPKSSENTANTLTATNSMPSSAPVNAFLNKGDFGANNKATAEEVANVAKNGNNAFKEPTSFTNQAYEVLTPNAIGADTAQAATEAEKQLRSTRAAAEGQALVKNWDDELKNSNSSAIRAQDSIDLLNSMKENWKNIPDSEKGTVMGLLPARSDEAKLFDQQANKLINADAAQFRSDGVITDSDLRSVRSAKPSRILGDKAFNYAIDFMKGARERAQEKSQFMLAAKDKNLTVAEANNLWAKYIHDRPFWDPKEEMVNDDNMNTSGDFLTDKKINAIRNPELGSRGNKPKKNASDYLKDAQWPTWNSKEEFQNWYFAQPKAVQEAYKKHRGW